MQIGLVQEETSSGSAEHVRVHDVIGMCPGHIKQLYTVDELSKLPGPQVFLVTTRAAGYQFNPHFHDVDQFQVSLRGGGRIGKEPFSPGCAHYADAYTPYGPIVVGEEGLDYMTVRAKVDTGARYMPGSGHLRKRRKPVAYFFRPDGDSQQRLTGADGLEMNRAHVAPGKELDLLVPAECGGQVSIVVSGSVTNSGKEYPQWSCIYVAPGERSEDVRTGSGGAELLTLRFPVPKED